MITVINHHIRKKLGISCSQYIVMDVCAQYKNISKPTLPSEMSELTGVSQGVITSAMNELRACSPSLLEKSETGSYYPTAHWYLAHLDRESVVSVVSLLEETATEVINFFNEVNSSKYQVASNVRLVVNILKANSKITLDHFKSVVVHKHQTWGRDEKMKEYNRPSTLFGSPRKFMQYLDDANMYWLSKKKEMEHAEVAR